MVSMFNRRSRSLSTVRPTTSASSPAHLAAASAFLASQPSHSNLSASAAATALRTMSPPPTAVDQIQTKRMLNRQASNSSVGGAERGRSRGTVQRRLSAGSMTERTFRSPSPGQKVMAPSPRTSVEQGAPPVPSLPHAYIEDVPPLPAKHHRRSASMEAPPPRVSSPLLTRPTGRGQKVTNAPVSASSSAATAAARRSAHMASPSQIQRSDSQESRNSINFSYPRGSRPSSPPPKSPLTVSNDSVSKFPTNGISAAEAARIQHELTQTAAKPVKKKKSRIDPSAAEGSHLQGGTMGAKPTVTPLGPLPPDYVPPEPAEPPRKTKKKAVLSGESSHFPEPQQSSTAEGAVSDSDNAEGPKDRRALRGAGVLMKHPSVVREDWEGEQKEEGTSPVEGLAVKTATTLSKDSATSTQSKKASPAANMSRKIEDPPVAPRKLSSVHSAVTADSTTTQAPVQSVIPASLEASGARKPSVSPSRSTRFSDRLASDMVAGQKHEPLGRSISPAKSALKRTSIASDMSPTESGFPRPRGSSVTPSEASEASADGTSGKRKSVRVSFDEVAVVKDSTDNARSSKDTGKKSLLNLGKGKALSLEPITADEDLEEGMKPRPALPSFGSVRRKDRSISPIASVGKPVTQQSLINKSASSSETSSIADPPTMNTSISSDHALGGFISREQYRTEKTSSHTGKEPLPPTVTSVEGTGYESDTDSVYSDEEKPMHAAQSASQQLGKAIGGDDYSQVYKDEIPVIAVQPATPGLDEHRPGEEYTADVPGGFPNSATWGNASVGEPSDVQAGSSTPVREPTGLGFEDDLEDHDVSINSSPQPLMTIAEEDSDVSSLYSDAAEDLSDLDGDGFGSINAIVESPMVAPPKKKVVTSAESPIANSAMARSVGQQQTAGWDETQAHWSGLAQRSREGTQLPATPESRTKKLQTTVKTGSRAVTNASTTSANLAAAASTSLPAKQNVTKSQPASSAPAAPAGQTVASTVIATKQKVTAKGQGHLRSSMRGEPEPIIAPITPRPASHAALQKKHVSPATAAAVVPTKKPIMRRFSNDSDSDSSFKKARRGAKPAEGKYTMKRSMRNAPPGQAPALASTDRNGVRSLSPPSDRRPLSPMGARTFRTSMRNSSDLNVSTMRVQPEGKRSSSLFSRNRTAKSPPRPAVAVTSMSSKIKSRFADSDDEDGPRPTHYRSRFENSSDEDEPVTLRPVRGIPRREDEGESTDLDDSSDDQGRRNNAAPAKRLAIIPPSPSQQIASPPASPTTAKKRGLWSRIRGRKEESEIGPSSSQPAIVIEPKETEVQASKEETRHARQLGFGSVAEREAMIEQTRLKLEAARDRPQSPVGRPTSPIGKLSRRGPPQRVFSDSWAPPKAPAPVDDRPQTSGGAGGGVRPTVGSRQPTTSSTVLNGDGSVYGKNGKKKKFGFLRKAFGLTD